MSLFLRKDDEERRDILKSIDASVRFSIICWVRQRRWAGNARRLIPSDRQGRTPGHGIHWNGRRRVVCEKILVKLHVQSDVQLCLHFFFVDPRSSSSRRVSIGLSAIQTSTLGATFDRPRSVFSPVEYHIESVINLSNVTLRSFVRPEQNQIFEREPTPALSPVSFPT